MKSLYLTLLLFIQVLLASFILYSTISSATPVADSIKPKSQAIVAPEQQAAPVAVANKQQQVAPVEVGPQQQNNEQNQKSVQARTGAVPAPALPVAAPQQQQQHQQQHVKHSPASEHVAVAQEQQQQQQKDSPVVINHHNAINHHKEHIVSSPVVHEKKAEVPMKQAVQQEAPKEQSMTAKASPVVVVQSQPQVQQVVNVVPAVQQQIGQLVASSSSVYQPYQAYQAQGQPKQQQVVSVQSSTVAPIVKGGLGPLHLLATTLCSYQPDKQVADETQNLLYSRRAAVRKSLFDFMSLKFTQLERFSSRLNPGLEVVPPKVVSDPSQSSAPSHGWPVVGKCTAHDLKLMAEAAWCECAEESTCGTKLAPASSTPAVTSVVVPQASKQEALDNEEPKITSNHHLNRAGSARSIQQLEQQQQQQISAADKSAIISKILHVSDVKDAPVVESTIASLNLTQQQLANIQAQATSTRECRKNALKMTKALFNHLAEDQRVESESWPKLYAQMAADECARKRMIDIVSALSSYRTEASTIRRDNVEFAFAMDDLRTKVLESEVNVPLTFDKQFIEVGQFLQQSVKLMLTNIDPDRARLTSMRYRSLMPGPVSSDDQCIELHQRLLAKNYPTDCNPTQFGQLPDVLRMAASSLELWSIESELSRYSQQAAQNQKLQSQPLSCSYQQTKHDVNECIANLVSY